jgi:ribulose-5-phosphate 4-epimerase/fuculose-1-phosphate aldolase
MASAADLVKCCRRLYEKELVSSTGGNVSIRTADNRVLISPTGRALVDLKANDFVEVTLDGATIGDGRPSKELPFHLACYEVRPDVRAVIHGHCAYAVAASTMLDPDPIDSLPAYTAGYLMRVGRLPLLPYLPAGSVVLSQAVAAAIGAPAKAVLLQNHGLIAVGPDLDTAFNTADELLDAVKVFVLSGGRARPLPATVCEALLDKALNRGVLGVDEPRRVAEAAPPRG